MGFGKLHRLIGFCTHAQKRFDFLCRIYGRGKEVIELISALVSRLSSLFSLSPATFVVVLKNRLWQGWGLAYTDENEFKTQQQLVWVWELGFTVTFFVILCSMLWMVWVSWWRRSCVLRGVCVWVVVCVWGDRSVHVARERCSYQEKAVKARLSGRKPALIFDNGIKPKHPSPFTSHHTCLLPFFSDFFFSLSFTYLSSPCSTARLCCSKGEH